MEETTAAQQAHLHVGVERLLWGQPAGVHVALFSWAYLQN